MNIISHSFESMKEKKNFKYGLFDFINLIFS